MNQIKTTWPASWDNTGYSSANMLNDIDQGLIESENTVHFDLAFPGYLYQRVIRVDYIDGSTDKIYGGMIATASELNFNALAVF